MDVASSRHSALLGHWSYSTHVDENLAASSATSDVSTSSADQWCRAVFCLHATSRLRHVPQTVQPMHLLCTSSSTDDLF